MSEYLWQYQIILLLYNCEICLNICTLSVCFWNMCPGAEVEYNDCVIHILTAMALIKHKHTQITTTQSAWTPTDTSGLDHLHSTTSDNNNTQSIFFPFPQVCVCVCVCFLLSLLFFQSLSYWEDKHTEGRITMEHAYLAKGPTEVLAR